MDEALLEERGRGQPAAKGERASLAKEQPDLEQNARSALGQRWTKLKRPGSAGMTPIAAMMSRDTRSVAGSAPEPSRWCLDQYGQNAAEDDEDRQLRSRDHGDRHKRQKNGREQHIASNRASCQALAASAMIATNVAPIP